MKKALALIVGSITALVGAFSFTTPVFADTIEKIIDTGSNSLYFGQSSAANPDIVQIGYVPAASHNICTVTVDLIAVGSPTDGVELDLYNSPSVGTTTMTKYTSTGVFYRRADSAYQIRDTANFSTRTFTFSPCAVVAGNYQYWYVLKRTLASSDTNYYGMRVYVSGTGGVLTPNTGTGFFGVGNVLVNTTYTFYTSFTAPIGQPHITINGTENYGATTPGLNTGFAQSVINSLAGVTDDTTGLSAAASSTSAFNAILSYYGKRIPWGYIFDIRDAINNAATSSTEYSGIVFDYSDTRISTATRAWLPGSITVFSTTTVVSYLGSTTVAGINTLCASIITVLCIMYWFRRAIST